MIVLLLLSISLVCCFVAISLGYLDVPFTDIWKKKRELEYRKERLAYVIRSREWLYLNCEPYYQIIGRSVFQVVNSLNTSSNIERVRDIRTLFIPQASYPIIQVKDRIDFYFYIKLQLPDAKIRNGELVSEQVNYKAAERELSTHLPQFLAETGFSFGQLTVYQDKQGNYCLRVADVKYMPQVSGNQVLGNQVYGSRY